MQSQFIPGHTCSSVSTTADAPQRLVSMPLLFQLLLTCYMSMVAVVGCTLFIIVGVAEVNGGHVEVCRLLSLATGGATGHASKVSGGSYPISIPLLRRISWRPRPAATPAPLMMPPVRIMSTHGVTSRDIPSFHSLNAPGLNMSTSVILRRHRPAAIEPSLVTTIAAIHACSNGSAAAAAARTMVDQTGQPHGTKGS